MTASNTTGRSVSSFSDLRELYAEITASEGYKAAFQEIVETSQISHYDDATTADMPDPLQAQLAVELIMRTMFDLLNGTRMERFADRIAWGIVHSFHKVGEQIDKQADEIAHDIRRLVREQDGSEIVTLELEEAQTRCQSLDEARDVMQCMRDHAGEVYRVETNRPWVSPRGSTVSAKRTASVIAAHDFLRGRAVARRELLAPEGPVVVFSGGSEWHDWEQLYDRLSEIKARIPNMILATTAQHKGCDAIAAAWAASNGVKLVAFTLKMSLGAKAGFDRNKRLLALKPVEAVVCQGSGVQSNFYELLRKANVPTHAFRRDAQRPFEEVKAA